MTTAVNRNEILQLFFPEQSARQKFFQKNGLLSHYTSAQVFLSILKYNQFWMRETSLMNDYKEIQHGLDCIAHVYNNTDTGKKFSAYLEKLGLKDDFQKSFNSQIDGLRFETFITCLTEHDKEDELGKLSMWRAYGGQCPVAIILNSKPFEIETDFGVYSEKVRYENKEDHEETIETFIQSLLDKQELISKLNKKELLNLFLIKFQLYAISTKHKGFSEEKEWRVFYNPPRESPVVEGSIEVVNGIPQKIYKLKLENIPSKGVENFELKDFIHKVIIGPTESQGPVYSALSDAMRNAGISEVHKKLIMSDIPLR